MGLSKRDIALITTSPPRKEIPEKSLSYDMLNGLHREGIGLVAHGPAHMALMCCFWSSLGHEVSDHIKSWAKRGIDSTKLDVLTHEMNPHVDVTCSSLVGRMMPHDDSTLIVNVYVGGSGIPEAQVFKEHTQVFRLFSCFRPCDVLAFLGA